MAERYRCAGRPITGDDSTIMARIPPCGWDGVRPDDADTFCPTCGSLLEPAGQPDDPVERAVDAAKLALVDAHGKGDWLMLSFNDLARIAIQAAEPILLEHAREEQALIASNFDDFRQAAREVENEAVRWQTRALEIDAAIEEHVRHMTDGRWHDGCRWCRRRRERGGTGVSEEEMRHGQ